MRTVPKELQPRIDNRIQAPSENTQPRLNAWITRPQTPIVNDFYLEKQKILDYGNISAVDIAVRHPRFGYESDEIYVGYVADGTANIKKSNYTELMEKHVWESTDFSAPASDIALAFDSVSKRDLYDKHEYVTEKSPWVFWINEGALYGQILGSESDPTLLVENSCTAVSAVRASYNEIESLDFGLCVFFIAGSLLMYRQYIHGVWYDAITVTKLPEGVTFTDVSAHRTWDYKIVLNLLGGGFIYELYSQYGGIGTRSQEHVEISDITADGKLTKITYTDTKADDEHIEISQINATGALLYAFTSSPVRAYNTNTDEGDGDYGRFVNVEFDHPVHNAVGKNQHFVMTDTNGNIFGCVSVKEVYNGMGLRLEFLDFNVAAKAEKLTLTYTEPLSGGVMSPVVPLESFSIDFVPENLVAPDVPAPSILGVINV